MKVLCFSCALLLSTAASAVTLTAENVEVVAPYRVYGTTQIAADEMTNALSQVFGRAVKRTFRPTPGKVSIILGTNEWSAAAGIDVRTLPRDGFVMKTVGGRIFIAGRDSPLGNAAVAIRRGSWFPSGEYATLFGVYEFLERFANARFYFPGEFGEIVPAAAKLRAKRRSMMRRTA